MATPQVVPLPDRADRVLIALNPKAGMGGGRQRAQQVAGELAGSGLVVSIETKLEVLVEKSEEAFTAGRLRAVVAAGGDGTAQEIVNRTSVGMPLAMLPLGTENLLAKFLGVAGKPEQVVAAIVNGQTVRLDGGLANDRVFLLHVGVGFDAEVVRRMAEERTGNIFHLSYLGPIWQSIQNYQYPQFRIHGQFVPAEVAPAAAAQTRPADVSAAMLPGNGFTADSSNSTIHARWAFVFNLPKYATGLPLAPQAAGHDGLLDLCTFREGSFQHGLWYLYNVLLGQHDKLADCLTRRACQLRLESDAPTPYQLDGDPGGVLPLEISVLPERLTLLVPPAWIQSYQSGNSSATQP